MEKRIEITFLHLHNPLFFANKNWGEKLDARQTAKGKIEMVYDRDLGEILIKSEKHVAIIPISNVVSMTPMAANQEPLPKPTSGKGANAKIQAQVSGPHDHVFAGPGSGQTGSLK